VQIDRARISTVNIAIERWLLVLAVVFLSVNFAALSLIRPDETIGHLLTLLTWLGCAGTGHLLLNRYLPQRDPYLFAIGLFLCGWGLVVIDRLIPLFADRQSIWLIVSVAGMLIVAVRPELLLWLRKYRYLWLIFGLVLLVSTIILGANPSGQAGTPQLWLGFGTVFFQPSELLKIILVAFLASYLSEQYPILRADQLAFPRRSILFAPRIVGPIVLMWGISMVILVWQRDLGTAMLFFLIFLLLLYVASGMKVVLFGGLVLILCAGLVGYALFGVVQLRIDIWLSPWAEAEGRAYQIVQSLQAFASGGVFGQGIGQGSPFYVPVAHSDFVFAAIAEEWGFIGVVVLLSCLTVIVLRGFKIALIHQQRPFYALLAIGLSLIIAIQSLMICGGVLRVFPLTGVTLPFVSYGGSSLLTTFIITGLLLRLSAIPEVV